MQYDQRRILPEKISRILRFYKSVAKKHLHIYLMILLEQTKPLICNIILTRILFSAIIIPSLVLGNSKN